MRSREAKRRADIKYAKSSHGKEVHRRAKKKYSKTLRGILSNRFHQIKYRCNNPNSPVYKYYGGRGIRCVFASFETFFKYVTCELEGSPIGMDIDRIDNDGHYEKGNLRLVTHKENTNNRSNKVN